LAICRILCQYRKMNSLFFKRVEYYFALVKSIIKYKDVFPRYSDSEDINILDYISRYVILIFVSNSVYIY